MTRREAAGLSCECGWPPALGVRRRPRTRGELRVPSAVLPLPERTPPKPGGPGTQGSAQVITAFMGREQIPACLTPRGTPRGKRARGPTAPFVSLPVMLECSFLEAEAAPGLHRHPTPGPGLSSTGPTSNPACTGVSGRGAVDEPLSL